MKTSDKKKQKLTLHPTIDGGMWRTEGQTSNVQAIARKTAKTNSTTITKNQQTRVVRGKQYGPLSHSPPKNTIVLNKRGQLTKKLIGLRNKLYPQIGNKFEPIIDTQEGRFGIPTVPETAHAQTEYEYKESDILTNIDGYIVTDGETIQIIVSSNLSTSEKHRGVNEMLKYSQSKKPAIYLWRVDDNDNQ